MSGEMARLPKGWIWTTLSEVATVITGNTPSKKDPSNYGDFIPFVKPPELRGGLITGAEDSLSEKGAGLARILPADSILVSCIGNLGRTGMNKTPAAFNQQINAVVFPVGIVAKYGFYYSQTLREWLSSIASATTVTIVNKSRFEGARVPIAPLPEQHRIVARIEELFTRLDAGVEALRKIKAQLKRYRQAVLKHAFEGKLTAEWREAYRHELEPASVLLERIKQERRKTATAKYRELPLLDTSDLSELPEGWVWTRLGEMLDVIRGASPRPKGDPRYFGGGIPWIMISDISREKGRYVSLTKDTVTKEGAERSRYLKKGTLILSNSGTVCVPKILAVDGCIHDGFVAFPDIADQIDIMYLYHVFDYIRPSVTQANRQGVTQVNLNTGIVRNIIIPFCPILEQHRIVEEIERRFSVADQIEKTVDQGLKQAERLRQSILKRAFEGKLVPQDPNDEPAEILLERIREERAIVQAGATPQREPRKKATTQEMGLI